MKNERPYQLLLSFLLLLLIAFPSCSTKKNNWARRNYFALTSHYNINYNGKQSYQEGIKNIQLAQKDDYSSIIPLFPISNHSNATAGSSQMDFTIEKGRKAIKTRSIKKKPKKNLRKAGKPSYKAFYDQTEFNPALKDAWLLVGKAEFHKADFLGSIGTFSYIAKLYAGNKDMLIQSQLWKTRAYTELDWLYEAEQILAKIDQNELKQSNLGLFAAATVCLQLKREQYKEAIPFLKLYLSKEENKPQKIRASYLLAQLYQANGDKELASKTYGDAIKKNPPYEMRFNALLNQAGLKSESNNSAALKDLGKMAGNRNNKIYLDQIYHSIGKIYLQKNDSTKAKENYELASNSSIRNGIEKANALIDLADICYEQKEYKKAETAYGEASRILSTDQPDYKRILNNSELLGELNKQKEIVELQDSLLKLSTLPESEQRKIIDEIIAEVQKQDKENQKKSKKSDQQSYDEDFDTDIDEDFEFQNTIPNRMSSGKWYFYNPSTVSAGKTAFRKNWGNRKLEDNWRRKNKTGVLFADNSSDEQKSHATTTETTASDQKGEQISNDNTNPDFYLLQIPKTTEQIANAKLQLSNALLAMGEIFKDKIYDFEMAKNCYIDFINRFGNDERVPEAYFQVFLTEKRQEKDSEAEAYRKKLIQTYPESKQAKLLSNKDYIESFIDLRKKENQLYKTTYEAYTKNEFRKVSENFELAKKEFPLSILLPKFSFLDALAVGKMGLNQDMEQKLDELIKTYPESDISAMAKNLLALIRQGKEAQKGKTHGSLLAKRELEQSEDEDEKRGKTETFSLDKEGKHKLMLVSPKEESELYQLMYEVASYNFTSFMIKEFDLELNKLNNKNALTISNFESYKEIEWYLNSIVKNSTLNKALSSAQVKTIIISESNFALAQKIGFDAYLYFQKNKSLHSPKLPELPVDKTEQTEKKREAESKKIDLKEEKNSRITATEEISSEKSEERKEEVSLPSPIEENETETTETTIETEEELDLYKELFAYQPNKTHFIGIYILSGKMDFDKFKKELEAYNTENYNLLNLEISLETIGRRSMIIVGEFNDADIAKSYLMRIVKEKAIFNNLRGSNYRNLIGTQRNFNVMIKNNALTTYDSFMQEFYLK